MSNDEERDLLLINTRIVNNKDFFWKEGILRQISSIILVYVFVFLFF